MNRIRVSKSVAVGNSYTIKSAERFNVERRRRRLLLLFCKSTIIIIFKIILGENNFRQQVALSDLVQNVHSFISGVRTQTEV